MDSQRSFDERRKHRRFHCKNCAVTVNYKACPVINISMGGFAFSYSNVEDWHQDRIEKAILFGDNIRLEEITFHTVSDLICSNDSPDFLQTRRRCVRFHDLRPSQKVRLQGFINHLAESTENTT
jgi:alanine racemase